MTTPSEFKFDCPECGQHIQATKEWSGRQINCPACKKPVVIPSPPETSKASAPTTSGKSVLPPQPKPSGGTVPAKPPEKAAPAPAGKATPAPASRPATASPSPVVTPVKRTDQAPPEKAAPVPAAQTAATSPSPTVTPLKRVEPAPAAKPTATAAVRKTPETLRVAVLTPAIKLEMVRAVRRRIADESNWLPGKINGANAYAAKSNGPESKLLDVKSPEATRFSLIGAFELEFYLRNVITTAEGRAEFLNQEIPDAVREVLRDKMSEGEREQTEDPLAKTDVMSISHAQCLAVLDVLEERYSQTMHQAQAAKAEIRMDDVRLSDLVKKLEAKVKISPEDVATALYHELTEIRRRLERLESRTNQSKKDT